MVRRRPAFKRRVAHGAAEIGLYVKPRSGARAHSGRLHFDLNFPNMARFGLWGAMPPLEEYFSPLVGFFSYSREDDENSDDALSNFRGIIHDEGRAGPRP